MKLDESANQGRGSNPKRVSGGQFVVLCVLGYLAAWLVVAVIALRWGA